MAELIKIIFVVVLPMSKFLVAENELFSAQMRFDQDSVNYEEKCITPHFFHSVNKILTIVSL